MSDPVATSPSAYVPGVCNINPNEVKKRRNVGHIGLVILVVLLVVFLVLNISRYIRIILFLPAFISAIGYLQAKNKFCVGYGGAGQQHADTDSALAVKVTEVPALSADKKRSRQLNLQAFIAALVITVITILIPHI
jgi:predicted nucleic acid-binding Zn ribbon protein